MHAPSQGVRPELHAAAHDPPLQNGAVPAHAIPQPPQLAASLTTSTHAPPQARVPAGHAHRPPVHACDSAQTAPQAPQSRTSVARSTQLAPHAVSPALHEEAQAPRLQRGEVPPHATEHSPQLRGSERRGVQAPPHAASPARRQIGGRAPASTSAMPGKSSETVPPQARAIADATSAVVTTRQPRENAMSGAWVGSVSRSP
jgi:hypothetical protein